MHQINITHRHVLQFAAFSFFSNQGKLTPPCTTVVWKDVIVGQLLNFCCKSLFCGGGGKDINSSKDNMFHHFYSSPHFQVKNARHNIFYGSKCILGRFAMLDLGECIRQPIFLFYSYIQ
jgi:hypothetical protein